MLWSIFLSSFGLLLMAAGIVLSMYAWRNWRLSAMLGLPLSRIAKLQPGCRKARGTITPIGKPLHSPVTDKDCVYYRFRVQEYRTTYKVPWFNGEEPLLVGSLLSETLEDSFSSPDGVREKRTLHNLVDEVYDTLFAIEDDTGCIEVDLRGATVIMKQSTRTVANDNHLPPSHLEKLLREEYGIHTVDDRGFGKTLFFIEDALLVGAKVTIAGPVEQLKSGDFGFQQKGGVLVVSDRNMAKEGQSARKQAIGLTVAAAAVLGVGFGFLLGASILIAKVLLSRS